MMKVLETVQGIYRIFNARSVAVVGASGDPSKFGYMTLDSIIRGGFEGQIYPVNPKGGELLGLKVHPSLTEVPGQIDLVVVIVPAKFVPSVLREAGEMGVSSALILSGGFREAGRADLEEEISSISKNCGMRFAGPNVQGINYLPNKLCAMFYPVISTKGPLAIISQSGTVTAALSEWAADEGLGISAAVNLGNQTNLCESDYIDFFATDKNTKVIAMYLEGVKEGRHFLRTIERVASQKPIAILKGGRTAAGQKSAASHTGSMAGSYDVFNAACRQFGAFGPSDLETLYDGAKALATMRPPKGNRVLIISTSGGAGTLGADEAEVQGLEVPPLSEELVEELKRLDLSPLATLSNPLDLVSIDAEHFRQIVLVADQFDVADVFLLNFGDPVVGAIEVTKYIAATLKGGLAVSYQGGGEEEKLGRVKMQEAGIPVFPTPERAMRGIAAAARYARYRETRKDRSARPSVAYKKEQPLPDKVYRFVPEHAAVEYLRQYNIPYPEHQLAHTPEEAMEIADGLGYPVVLKIVSPDVLHKSDAGGVALGLETSAEVNNAFKRIIDRIQTVEPAASVEGLLVCRQAPKGLEVIVGVLEDPVFGATIMFGMGGIFTEVLRDVSFRVAPLDRYDAEEMIREIRGYALLTGVRGHPGYDIEALIELMLAVSQLVIDRPDIKELDLNPVRLFEKGLIILDVRIMEKGP